MKEGKVKKPKQVIDKDQWVAWHRAFETHSGEAHHQFLRSLGIPEKEAQQIRAWSKE